MHHILGIDRFQLTFSCLEDAIPNDNPVRIIDAFIDMLDLELLGFNSKPTDEEQTKKHNPYLDGRPSFEPKILLKLYFYGYFNGVRSSRRLEKECLRNIEVRWLINGLAPNYHTIADFRKINPKALKNCFKLYTTFLQEAGLIGGKTIAVDGSKFRASNSKKNNYSQNKIDRHLNYIEQKLEEYLQQLDQADSLELSEQSIQLLEQKIDYFKNNKINYELLQEQLKQSGDTQLSTTDPDARALLVQGQVVEVSYNVQAAVDDKHKLVVATHVINKNDRNALHDIASEAKENLHSDGFTVLADKGYHNGRELQDCQNNGIQTIVAPSEIVNSNKFGTTEEYLVTKFTYNPDNDTYTCPQGSTLTSTGTWHKKTRERDHHLFKKYRTPDCKTCPVKHLCTGRKDGGREIERSEYAEAVEANLKNLQGNKELYKRRQMIIEHIYGTAKRKWGFNFTDLRGLEKVNGEFALIMTVYNLKRTINILGIPELLQLIQNWKPDYKRVSLALKSSLFGLFKALLAFKTLIYKTNELNLKLTQVQDYLSTNPLYSSEMRFFQKTESFFTA
ncbi:IS1182 family transposase [Mongoliitalea daihaiensis]|uniref:IS1182 family transposase n=1 Tax=Mongoliitalea daihaiensis TaxID=2782006 RepID=UPI001F3AF0FD|nr:IS1182 family transposase [Mongoliitalea daihaiensis]